MLLAWLLVWLLHGLKRPHLGGLIRSCLQKPPLLLLLLLLLLQPHSPVALALAGC